VVVSWMLKERHRHEQPDELSLSGTWRYSRGPLRRGSTRAEAPTAAGTVPIGVKLRMVRVPRTRSRFASSLAEAHSAALIADPF